MSAFVACPTQDPEAPPPSGTPGTPPKDSSSTSVAVLLRPALSSVEEHLRASLDTKLLGIVTGAFVVLSAVYFILLVSVLDSPDDDTLLGKTRAVAFGTWVAFMMLCSGIGLLVSWKPIPTSIVSSAVLFIVSAILGIPMNVLLVGSTSPSSLPGFLLIVFSSMQVVLSVVGFTICYLALYSSFPASTGAVVYNSASGGDGGNPAAIYIKAAMLPEVKAKPVSSGGKATVVVEK